MINKNIFELNLISEKIHEGIGECLHTTVFHQNELQTNISFVNFTVVPPSASFGLHKHSDNNEIYIILSGEGKYTEDGESVKVQKGSVMVNKPFGEHGILNTGNTNLEILVMEVYNDK